jgi:hypothetical protein
VKVPKIHLSRKLVLIVGGIMVLCGGTGGAAVYIGADTLLGPSYAELNGLECTEVQVVEIRKKDRYWVRKYVTTSEPGDGLSRVKTALRVAKLVQVAKKADLVQVVVLDTNGPKDRASMRGRAVGADVIYVPDPARVPEASAARVLTARYADGLPAANGQFFGERVDMIEGDVQALLAKLDDSTDCVTPEVAVPEGAEGGHGESKADSHGKKSEGHGEAPADGHGEAPAEGHGEAPADGHGEAPAGEHGEETPVAEHGAEESKGWMASLMGMVGLGGDEAPAEAHGAADAGHGEAPAEGHGDSEGHAAPSEDSAALPEGSHGDAGAEHAPAPADAAAAGHEAPEHGDPAAVPAEEGHADAGGNAGSTEVDEASAPASHEAEVQIEEVPVETTPSDDRAANEAPAHEAASAEPPAENGGWLSSLKSMVGLGGEEAAASGEGDAAPTVTPAAAAASGEDHGAAWLEKMRSQPIEPSGDAAAPTTAPEEHGAATDHTPAATDAEASHAIEGAAPPAEDETELPPKKVIPTEEARVGH